MKKLLLPLLTAALLLSLCSGCGAPKAPESGELTEKTPTPEQTEQVPAPLPKPDYTVAPELLAKNRCTLTRHTLDNNSFIGGQSCVRSGHTLYYRADCGEEELVTGIYAADLATGRHRLLANYPPMPETEQEGFFRSPTGFFAGENGTVWIVESRTQFRYELPETFNPATENRWDYLKTEPPVHTLRNLNAQGQELFKLDVPRFEDFRSGSVCGDLMLLAELNRLHLYEISTGRNLAVFPTELNVICTLNYENGLAAAAQDGTGKVHLIKVDLNAQVPLPPVALNLFAYAIDSVASLPGGGCITAGEGELYFTCQGNPFAVNVKSGAVRKLADWIDCGVNTVYVATQSVAEDGSVAAIYHRGEKEAPLELLVLSPTSEPAPDAALTLGMLSHTVEALDAIIDHNAAEPARRIRAVNYAEYPAFGQQPQIMLRTDIAVGKGPDMIFSPERDIPVTELAAGYLEDLYPYVNGDRQLQEEGLIQSVLKLQEEDGKLLSVTPDFWLTTAISTKALVGTGTLTASRATNLYHQLSTPDSSAQEPFSFQDAVLQEHISRNSLLYGVAENDAFNFNNPSFQEGLNYTAQFPAEIDWSKYENGADPGWVRIRAGKQLLFTGHYYGFDALSMDLYAVGDGAVLCGFPDVQDGHVLELWNTYGILSTGINQDAAWQFLRKTLLAEPQRASSAAGFPTNLTAFAAKGKEAMQREGTRLLHGGETKVEIPAQLSQAQYNEILAAVEKTTARYHADHEVFYAVWPQAKAYFDGKQDLSVTAAAAQAAAQNYHNPQISASNALM